MKEPRDYTAEDFAAEPDIKKRRKMFLDSTVAFYNSTNRALNDDGLCVYQPTQYSKGCAIGRFASALAYREGCILDTVNYNLLPSWMQMMGSSFIFNCQLLHDNSSNWEPYGLSETGKLVLNDFNIFL